MLSLACGLLMSMAARPAFQISQLTETRCQDTWLDRVHSDINYGRDTALSVGPDSASLIRFPLIDQLVPSGYKVTDAKIVLRILDKSTPRNLVVSDPKQDWGEGGALGIETDAAGKPLPAQNGWATYKAARRGQGGWILPIEGTKEALAGVSSTVNADVLTVGGLGPTVQTWVEDPTKNHGLLLTSTENMIFGSSETPVGPQLVVTCEATMRPGGPDVAVVLAEPTASGWDVKVENLGTRASGPMTVEWTSNGQNGNVTASNLESGQASTLAAAAPHAKVAFRAVAAADVDLTNNFVIADAGAVGVKLGGNSREQIQWQQTIRAMNEWILPRSRSHGFPDGSQVRLRVIVGGQPGLPEVSDRPRAVLQGLLSLPESFVDRSIPRKGLGWATDSRDDSSWVSGLPLPAQDVTPTSPNAALITDPRLLGSADVFLLSKLATLAQGWPDGPQVVMFRVKDSAGDPISDAEFLAVTPSGKVLNTRKSNASGVVIVAGGKGLLPDASNPWVDIKVTKAGETAAERISIWDMWREDTRIGKGVATLELRVPLPSAGVDRASDLAFKRILRDEAGRKPGALDALVDDDKETSLAMDSDQGKGWVEIDLGRDKPIAEVQLVFSGEVPEKWKLSTSETGNEDQVAWVTEEFGQEQAAKWADKASGLTTVKVRARVRLARRIRLALGRHQKATLVAIRAYSITGG